MAGDKYFYNAAGIPTEKAATQTSAGAGDAGKIVALNSAGDVDITMMPPGVGAECVVNVAKEALAAGDWVQMYLDTGVLQTRLADANNGRPCNGFVSAVSVAAAPCTVFALSNTNSNCSGLTIGTVYYLSETPGAEVDTAPTAAASIVQRLGVATSATSILFDNCTYFVLA